MRVRCDSYQSVSAFLVKNLNRLRPIPGIISGLVYFAPRSTEALGGTLLRLSNVGLLLPFVFTTLSFAQSTPSAQTPPPNPLFKLQEVMIPVRDGVRLQTTILTPVDQKEPLPILFRRTPYGVPEKAPEQMPSSLKELAQDGYIFVIQNLRGRFKSEGVSISPHGSICRIPKPPTRPPMPMIRSNGSSRISRTIMERSGCTESPTTA